MNKIKWNPLFKKSEIKDRILNYLQVISSELSSRTEIKNTSLLTGIAGESVFWAYLAQLKQSETYSDRSAELIGSALNSLSSANGHPSFSSGISGILWAFNHLVEIGVIEADIDDMVSDEINMFLIKYSVINLNRGCYDYLHEGLGPHMFFLCNTSNKHIRQALEDSVSTLESCSEKFKEGIAWRHVLSDINGVRPNEIRFNLGLAHGNPSIAVILARMLQSDIKPKNIKKLLEDNVHWLLDKKQTIASSSLFSYSHMYTKNSDFTHSRLAWCYGDLGIAIAIYQVGLITANALWQKEAIEIALHASQRRDISETLIKDAELCHGSIGVAHIFNRLYQYTQVEDFKDSAKYWYLQTLDFFEKTQGMNTLIRKGDVFEFENVTGLLEGVSGIGLGLIASISDIEPKWDRALLLS